MIVSLLSREENRALEPDALYTSYCRPTGTDYSKKGELSRGVTCVHCTGHNISEIYSQRSYRMWRCRPCNRMFSAKTKSLMYSSNIGFRKWCIAVYLVTTSLKGIASTKLGSDLNIRQSSAWHMIHRIRAAYSTNGVMEGIVETDETYIGGIEGNKHERRKLKAGAGYVGKKPVIGLLSRDSNHIHAECVKTVSVTTLQRTVMNTVQPRSTACTDQLTGYVGLTKFGYEHQAVNHGAKQFVDGMAHTNGIESFWSMLKRGYVGTYHYISHKHLQRYVNEFAGRHNDRCLNTLDQMSMMARGMNGKQLSYKTLVGE